MTSLTARTEAELAECLGVTRATVYQWRRDHTDAPPGRDLHEWRGFIAAKQLGTKSKGAGRYSPRAEVEESILRAEASLFHAESALAKISALKAKEFQAQRRRMAAQFEKLWHIVG